MSVDIKIERRVAIITLSRGKVNALNSKVIADFSRAVNTLANDKKVDGLILTGSGKFFSFGFDVPEIYNYSPKKMTSFVKNFSKLLRDLFLFPKPTVSAVNGHATAGGCLVSLTAEYRIMTNTGAKMSLHELSFGASLFSTAVEMLRYNIGNSNSETVLLSGKLFDSPEALKLGLVHELADQPKVLDLAELRMQKMALNYCPAYGSLKRLLRRPLMDKAAREDVRSIKEWIKIWYSPETRAMAKEIKIY